MIENYIIPLWLCQGATKKTFDLAEIKIQKNEYFFTKPLDFDAFAWYNSYNKCEEQKPVGWKNPAESCRLVRGKGGVLLEFILLAVR